MDFQNTTVITTDDVVNNQQNNIQVDCEAYRDCACEENE
jgi:hypothetical protein